MPPTVQKALLLQSKHGDFAVGSIGVPHPDEEEVLVEIYSSALNPVDWKIQKEGRFVENFPSVLGSDIAGTVVALGSGVTQFAQGDRVFFQGVYNENDHGGFQQYSTADVCTLAKIPSNISYDEASSIPVAHTAAYVGLYNVHPYGLGFDPPVKSGAKGKYADTPIVIIGGSSSVGQFGTCCSHFHLRMLTFVVIQLAKLFGFSPIITTSSLQYSDFLESLGASHVLDRNLPLSKSQIGVLTEKPIKVVYDAISTSETQEAGLDVLVSGGQLATVKSNPDPVLKRGLEENKILVRVVGIKGLPHNVDLLRDFWTHATSLLEDGNLKPNRTEVLPNGLDGIPQGLKRLEENKVSGTKLISRPQEAN